MFQRSLAGSRVYGGGFRPLQEFRRYRRCSVEPSVHGIVVLLLPTKDFRGVFGSELLGDLACAHAIFLFVDGVSPEQCWSVLLLVSYCAIRLQAGVPKYF